MKHYPASRAPARIEGVTVSTDRTPPRLLCILVGAALFAAGFALGCVTSAHAALP